MITLYLIVAVVCLPVGVDPFRLSAGAHFSRRRHTPDWEREHRRYKCRALRCKRIGHRYAGARCDSKALWRSGWPLSCCIKIQSLRRLRSTSLRSRFAFDGSGSALRRAWPCLSRLAAIQRRQRCGDGARRILRPISQSHSGSSSDFHSGCGNHALCFSRLHFGGHRFSRGRLFHAGR